MDMDDPIVEDPGQWVMIEAVNGTKRVVMRLRTDRPNEPDIDSYATAIVIGWAYPEQDGTPKPADETYERMLDLERALDELSMGNGHSFLMNVSLGAGLREWCYYARDRERFMARFNALLAGHEPYPVKIEFHDDREWKVWLDLRRAYERTGGESAVPANPPVQPTKGAGLWSGIRKWFGRGPGR